MQQWHADVRLKKGNGPAYRCRRTTRFAAGTGEASFIERCDEDFHGVDAVHNRFLEGSRHNGVSESLLQVQAPVFVLNNDVANRKHEPGLPSSREKPAWHGRRPATHRRAACGPMSLIARQSVVSLRRIHGDVCATFIRTDGLCTATRSLERAPSGTSKRC